MSGICSTSCYWMLNIWFSWKWIKWSLYWTVINCRYRIQRVSNSSTGKISTNCWRTVKRAVKWVTGLILFSICVQFNCGLGQQQPAASSQPAACCCGGSTGGRRSVCGQAAVPREDIRRRVAERRPSVNVVSTIFWIIQHEKCVHFRGTI